MQKKHKQKSKHLRKFRKFKANSKYKDRLFCLIFGKEEYKANALELYNAINHTNYTNIDDFEIYTIDDAVFMKMKNDVAFLFTSVMALYEHQSTINPNMPLRGFMYFGDLYNKYIVLNDLNIYGKSLIKIPTPQYIVFYNGTEPFPEVKELKLSDAFIQPIEHGSFEWTATVYNINDKNNINLKETCKPLRDYMIFVEKVRKYRYNMSLESAVEKATNECIEEDVLKDILLKNKSEIMKSCLTEFNEKKYEAMVRKELAEQYSEQLKEKDAALIEKDAEIKEKDAKLIEKDAALIEKDAEIKSLKEQLAKLQKQ